MKIRHQRYGWLVGFATCGLLGCSGSEEATPEIPSAAAENSQLRGVAVGGERKKPCQGRGGAAGMGRGAGQDACTIAEVVGALDGRLMQFPCANASSPIDDCDSLGYAVDGVVHGCSEGKSEMVLDHPITGAPGARFLLTLHFYGIMEPKSYGDTAVREAAPGAPDRNGGVPTSWATAPAGSSVVINSYDSYELLVHNAAGVETARHYLNASPDEGHWTLVINYEKTVEVEVGGFVRLRRFDNNCRLMKNCGATGAPPCAPKARTIDLSATEPPPPHGPFPAGFKQPGMNLTPSHAGQWWMVDVTAVTPL
jgi:hypothetical protein